ncbi:hypothetical protein SCLCIDRAFT_10550 [Scleroderma citrinum Foug A]|uniref:Iminophenyl-pyruvate dimer synthase domain-containing protein n=1 Tax=Scleroderma citrinum Foug A TaxID=1036808 RepID=A0A0C3DLC1_9AGAM|nr:hypothetical protein SCLCIDRAFT_10550 [Scleroderma citrinum Foug A]
MAHTPAERARFKKDITTLLRDAVHVELTTIPLYLYSLCSIIGAPRVKNLDPDVMDGLRAKAKIAVVVRQEMLHLALAGNILTSIDSGPRLYLKSAIPTYGEDETILHSKIPMKLEPCKKDNLECFLRIEAPYIEPPSLSAEDESVNVGTSKQAFRAPLQYKTEQLPDFNSIGEFYTTLERMILDCGSYVDFIDKDLQYTSQEFFGDLMTQVVDDKTAHDAIKTIIDQGEGSVGVEDAHYQMFLELYQKRTDWGCYPVPSSPHAEDFKKTPFVYQLALASNASYCYLLITLEKTWKVADPVHRRALITNTHAIMVDVLKPVADILVQQPQTPTKPNLNGAPPFEFYPTSQGDDPKDIDKAATELHAAIIARLKEAIKNASTEIQRAQIKPLESIIFSAERIPWPKST